MDPESCNISKTSHEVPLLALRPKTRCLISQLLNSTKVITSPEGLPRDWRGLAHLAGIIPAPTDSPDPVATILNLWEKQSPSPNIGQLQACFAKLDRYDILDDTIPFLEEDSKEYLKRKENGFQGRELANRDNDNHILTMDDVCRVQNNLEPQIYDAFLLYADDDFEFAKKMIDKLENDFGLKLCLKDRDLVGGLWFEHEAIMQLINERCNRLITIISPSFLESPFNKFFVTYAQALGIEQRQRKIIPCVYQRFALPPQLRHYFVLDYNRAGQFGNIWEKLYQSVSSKPLQSEARCAIKAPKSWEDSAIAKESCSITVTEAMGMKLAELEPPKKEKPRPKSPTITFLRKLLPSPEIASESGKEKSKTRLWFTKKAKKKPILVADS